MPDRPVNLTPPAGEDAFSLQMDAALLRGEVVLTPNLRTARRLAADFDAARRGEGLRAWQPANVLSWTAWTASLWQAALVDGVETRVLLNDLQERALWQRVLRQDDLQSLRPLASQARLCSGALRLLGAYDTRNRFGRMAVEDAVSDAAIFADWYGRFTALCSAESLLPASHLDGEIADLLRERKVAAADAYILYGFDRLTPAQRAVADALQGVGALLQEVTPTRPQAVAPRLISCSSPAHELQMCSAWAREALRAGEHIALVVPDLEAARPELERALRAVVAPALADVTQPDRAAPYEFSTGRPLSQVGMVADALRLLRWCSGALPVADAGAVLCSPHLSLAPTPERGAELDAFVLRDASAALLRAEVSITAAAGLVAKPDPATAAALHRLASAARALDGAHSTYAFFADESGKLLQRAGWPGAQALSSTAFQAVDRWAEALDRLATLDLMGARTTFAAFVDELADVVRDTLFASENTGAPMQVMGVSEAAGSTADALWFLHADDATWPQRRALHPLLPPALQRSLGMPGGDADEDEARGVMMRCVRSASHAMFSYAARAAEGQRRPSPLIESMPGIVAETVAEAPTPTLAPQVEEIADTVALPALPDAVAAGGVSVITAQAQCGFRAFAEHRLGLRAMERLDAGLSPRERGDQVHAVLQAFWQRVVTHAELRKQMKTINADGTLSRDATLRECIDGVILGEATHTWDAAYLDVQRERLFRLLSLWLDAEAKRPPFEVVATEFAVKSAAVGPLRLDMRVDRIDRVPTATGDATLLIDYKTGTSKVERNDWKGERPDAPQLPVYAIYGAAAGHLDDVRGIAFGSVRVGREGYKFEEMADGSLVGNTAKKGFVFDDQLAEWQHDLARLAQAFAQGEAAVNPKDHRVTCKQCAQRLLCRLDLTKIEDDDLLDEEEDEVPAW